MGQKPDKERDIKMSEEYLDFLRKRLNSANYRMSVSEQEYKKTQAKYDKEKLKLKFLKDAK